MKQQLLKKLTFVLALFAFANLSAQTFTFDSDLEGFTENFGPNGIVEWASDGGEGALKLTRSTNNANFGKGSGDNTDPSIVGIDADATPFIKIVIKNLTAGLNIRVGAKGEDGTAGVINFNGLLTAESGSYETYYLDITGQDFWNGNLTNFWIAVRGNVGTDSDAAYFSSIELLETLSVAENTLADVSVYPNPASGFVIIKTLVDTNVDIYNIVGKIVQTEKAISNESSIDVSDLSHGVYIIKLTSEDGRSATKKLIIK